VRVREKIYASAADLAKDWPTFEDKRGICFCSGVFDMLHSGHVELLLKARNQPGYLVVGINSDASVRRIKGEDRPIVKQSDRAFMLAALECVHSVFIFDEDTVVESLKILRPRTWVKGGDRTLETLDSDERKTAEEIGTRIVILPRIGDYSTTELVRRMKG
jgi:rfaE bifunctional protein nucleotidyltransferase chain/domain